MASASRRKLLLVSTAAILAAVLLLVLVTLPPRSRVLPPAVDTPDLVRRTVAGAYHVHSTISDGSRDVPAIAAAAARAGLQFVILTDHGDGTRTPAAPRYLDGVLCLEGVEISTDGGHYVALGLPATPYPLGGAPEAVAEDVHRLGGFGVAAHPDSPKTQLAWSDWGAPIDGLEWLNVDSEWRGRSRARLARVFLDYWIRPGPAMTSLLHRPAPTLGRWDALAASRPVVALAGHDAHGGIGRTAEDGRRSALGGVPSYESTFRVLSTHAILDAPWSGDPGADGEALLRVVRAGRVYTVIDGIAAPASVDFHARGPGGEARMGEVLRPGSATLAVSGVPPAGELTFFHGGEQVAGSGARIAGGVHELSIPQASGAWRFEIRLAGSPGEPPVPWIVSNPIYFLEPRAAVAETPLGDAVQLPADTPWHAEKDSGSTASVVAGASDVRFEYRLAAGERRSQFSALAADLGNGLGRSERIAFRARSDRPMRVSVQLRVPDAGGVRWARSVYVDSTPRDISVPVDRMKPADHQAGPLSDSSRARSLLFVVDLTNARPGDGGAFEISQVRFGR